VHRLQQGGEKRRIELSSQQATEIADLLGLIPKLLEAQAIAEIGLKQADRFDEAADAYFVNGKSIPGLRKSARVLGWNTGKREPQFPDKSFLYEYISLIERKYGGTTEGKKSAAEEMQNRYGIQSYEATVQRLKRARQKELEREGKSRKRKSDLDGILPNEWPSGSV